MAGKWYKSTCVMNKVCSTVLTGDGHSYICELSGRCHHIASRSGKLHEEKIEGKAVVLFSNGNFSADCHNTIHVLKHMYVIVVQITVMVKTYPLLSNVPVVSLECLESNVHLVCEECLLLMPHGPSGIVGSCKYSFSAEADVCTSIIWFCLLNSLCFTHVLQQISAFPSHSTY